MNKRDWFMCGFLVVLYLIMLATFKKDIFIYKFDHSLIDRYFLSQDITHEVSGQRLFLSDSDIYISTGYLYVTGSDPSSFNFEHPPLIKYFYGLSILFFNNPYWAQICIGVLLVITFYFVSKKMYHSTAISMFACFLLIIDPLFLDLSSQPLLDLGQTLFLLLYFLTVFYYKDNFLLQGIFLGFFASCKFWIPTFFFIGLFSVYKIYRKQFNYRYFMAHLGIAFLVYTLLYTQTFILKKGHFNIFWHFLKTIKYRLQHNTSAYPGAALIMYVTSYVKTWWGDQTIVSTKPWTPLWPVTFALSLWSIYDFLRKKIITERLIIAFIPLGYLSYLGVQASFSRYFMPILPFSYLLLASAIYKSLKHKEKL